MVVVVCTPLIHWLIKHFKFLPVALFGLCYLSRIFIPIHGFSATCFFWFSFGAYFGIHKKNMVTELYRFRRPAYIVAILTLLLLIWYNGRKGDGIHPNNPWVQQSYYIYVIASVISIVSIAVNLLRAHKVGVNKRLANSSFFIFLSHILALSYVTRISNHLLPDTIGFMHIFVYLIQPFITVAICLAVYALLGRFTPRLLSILTGSRT